VQDKSTNDTVLFEAIKGGRHELLEQLYQDHRAAFLTYAQRQLYATEDDAADCFQGAVIAFYKNFVSGRLTDLPCGVRTSLFAIGKRLVYRQNQQRHREVPSDPDAGIGLGNDPAGELDMSLLNRFEDDHRKAMLATALGKMGDFFKELLTLFYYRHYPIVSIQNNLKLSSPGATRIKKMRCLDKLKQILTPQS